ncbi:MAG: hypothetical protein R2865_09560 [Deinococcales bacterium]
MAVGEVCDENHANYVSWYQPQWWWWWHCPNRSRPSVDEKEESAPSYTQNVAGAYVFLRMGGNLIL